MSVLSRTWYRGSLTTGLIVAGTFGFAALPAEAAVTADIPGIDNGQSSQIPFEQMRARIAEIEGDIQSFENRISTSESSITEPELPGQDTAAEIPSPGSAQDTGTAGLNPSQGTGIPAVDQFLSAATQTQTQPQTQVQGTATGVGTVQGVIATALSKVGEGEAADGTTVYGKWYEKYTGQQGQGFASAPWCDMFLAWVAVQHGLQDQMGIFAYTPSHAAWFEKNNRFSRTPHPGDIVFFDWGGSKSISAIDHVGMVTAVNADGTVTTVEGNTSDKVMTRKRSMGTIVGFGHPAYAG
ncbi:CHAP domain-containing protein [Planobispora siamensis]|uniref:Peptidase C51 domain-containing protein n=1 Tax=Planobispora siamensis TaxID=936338 RepID=A0A8J3SPR9_9ACTN|nr:CHAP domain-containing protein [Planobispora siamensis]GIH97230.1 hypothetical protein Psi01_78600 [Planobispora siamensis]